MLKRAKAGHGIVSVHLVHILEKKNELLKEMSRLQT